MTNDYLFRALLQRNNKVLKALICSLLHLNISDVESVRITNPIEMGKAITAKEFILDIRVELNKNTIINLEMQVINEGNWPERSLCYLSRSFFADSSYMLSFSVLCSCVCSRLISPSVSSWHKQDNTLMHQSPGHIQRRTPYNF